MCSTFAMHVNTYTSAASASDGGQHCINASDACNSSASMAVLRGWGSSGAGWTGSDAGETFGVKREWECVPERVVASVLVREEGGRGEGSTIIDGSASPFSCMDDDRGGEGGGGRQPYPSVWHKCSQRYRTNASTAAFMGGVKVVKEGSRGASGWGSAGFLSTSSQWVRSSFSSSFFRLLLRLLRLFSVNVARFIAVLSECRRP